MAPHHLPPYRLRSAADASHGLGRVRRIDRREYGNWRVWFWNGRGGHVSSPIAGIGSPIAGLLPASASSFLPVPELKAGSSLGGLEGGGHALG